MIDDLIEVRKKILNTTGTLYDTSCTFTEHLSCIFTYTVLPLELLVSFDETHKRKRRPVASMIP